MNIVFYVLVVIAVIYVSKQAYNFTYQLYGPVAVEKAPGRNVVIQINKGDSTMDIATKLELNRAIVNKYSFVVKVKLQNLAIMAGTYNINTSMTYKEILDTITDYKNSIVQEEDPEAEQGSGSDSTDKATDATDKATADKETGNTDKPASDKKSGNTDTPAAD
jgi:UPF0755 protein